MNRFKKIYERLRGEEAEIMLESTLIMVIVMFILIAMISIGFLFYQQSVVTSITMEIAEEIGTNFRTSGDGANYSKIRGNFFRNTIFIKGKNTERQALAEKKFREKLKTATLGIIESEPEIKIEIISDNIGRLHIDVNTSVECSFPLQGALLYFKIIDSNPKLSASARAECLDITAYAGQVCFADYITDKATDASHIAGIFDDLIKVWDNVITVKDVFTN